MRQILFLLSVLLSANSAWATPFEDALRATVKLSGDSAAGTGFLIEKDGKIFLGTAAHVLHDMPGETCRIVYRAKAKGKSSERKEAVLKIRDGEQMLWKENKELDVAVIEWNMPDDSNCVPFPFDRIAMEEVAKKGVIGVGRDVCIPCHPVKMEANPAGWAVLRRRHHRHASTNSTG